MSRPQNGFDMDRPSLPEGSVKRAREQAQMRAAAAAAAAAIGNQSRSPPPPLTLPISQQRLQQLQRPRMMPPPSQPIPQTPQWPLAGPTTSTTEIDSTYQQNSGKPSPQRPPRPSQALPVLIDQETSATTTTTTPTLQFPPASSASPTTPRDSRDYPSMPLTPSSRHTVSSVGSIPDFPLANAQLQPPPPPPPLPPPAIPNNSSRRSVTLGPPPSSRRGASSFYSNASFVSPIPEESPRTRSHTSYASSAAIPESWGTQSPGAPSPNYSDGFFEEDGAAAAPTTTSSSSLADERGDEAFYEEFSDERQLVRSASIGKRGKPALVVTKTMSSSSSSSSGAASRGLSSSNDSFSFVNNHTNRPAPSPVQASPTFYVEASSSSSQTLPTKRTLLYASSNSTNNTPPPLPSPNPQVAAAQAMLGAYAAAGAMEMSDIRRATPSPRPYNPLSAIRRPPKLDMDSVREMEARGSMTSLPDLIRRATRLASMIDKGKRPASRADDLDYVDEKLGAFRDANKGFSVDERYRSGLSDMLAAFPPPAQVRHSPTGSRGSWFRTNSWPLAPGQETPPRSAMHMMSSSPPSDGGDDENKPTKKPARKCCGLPIWAFLLILVLVLGIVVTAVIVPLEFFVFRNLPGRQGDRQPALEECQAQVSCLNGGTNVISQGICSCICTSGFTGADCSISGAAGCTTTNLRSTREGVLDIDNVTLGQAIPRLIAESQANFSIPLSGTAILARFNSGSLSCIGQNSLVTFNGQASRVGGGRVLAIAGAVMGTTVMTVPPGSTATVTLSVGNGFVQVTTIFATTVTLTMPMAPPPTTTTILATTTLPLPPAQPTFVVSEDVLDFARVGVLFILQEDSVDAAAAAQSALQRFFVSAAGVGGVLPAQATNLSLGRSNSIDLVNFSINIGNGPVGARAAV